MYCFESFPMSYLLLLNGLAAGFKQMCKEPLQGLLVKRTPGILPTLYLF